MVFRTRVGALAAFAAALSLMSVRGAAALNYTSYVASNGSGSACTRAAPCATFAVAFAATEVSGEIICVDAGDFGGLRITSSISIDCSAARNASKRGFVSQPGASPSVVAGIIIDIQGDSAPLVRLRGLNVTPSYDDTYGIYILGGNPVYIEDSVIEARRGGIVDKRTGGQTRLYVTDSIIRNSGGPGVLAVSQTVGITVLDNVRLENNAYGLAAATGNNVVINRSLISGNTIAGVEADPGAQVDVSNSVLSHNTTNVQAYGRVRLRENDLKFSNTAIQGSGAVSMGANRFAGNGSLGTLPALATNASPDIVN